MEYRPGVKVTSVTFILIFIITIFAMNLMLALPAYAHRVVTYAYVEGEEIVVEGVFGNGAPIKEGEVKVYDPEGELLKKGKTDQKGIYKFNIPQKSNLKIVVGGEAGHQAEYTIKEEELPEMNFVKKAKDSSQQNSTTKKNHSEQIAKDEESSLKETEQIQNEVSQEDKDEFVSKENFRSILQEELDKKIGPLNKKIAQLKQEQGPGVTEILGGIGYIFGLMGVAFYFKAKGE